MTGAEVTAWLQLLCTLMSGLLINIRENRTRSIDRVNTVDVTAVLAVLRCT